MVVSGLKSVERLGTERMNKKVATLQLCLFLLIALSLVCIKPPGVRLLHGREPTDMYSRTENLFGDHLENHLEISHQYSIYEMQVLMKQHHCPVRFTASQKLFKVFCISWL